MSQAELELDLGGTAMSCTSEEVAVAFAGLLQEMRSVACLLRADERVALRMIMARKSSTLTVGHVFREFERESAEHKTLRKLRAAQFIRPAETGRWDADEPIEVKPFARLLWDRVGERQIFADDSEESVLKPQEQFPVAAPTTLEERAASIWEDDSVVDLTNVDDLQQYVEEELRQQI